MYINTLGNLHIHVHFSVCVFSLAILKIALCCCRLCGCHGRGMWAMRQLRSALQNQPKICYSNTHFPLQERWRDGWVHVWQGNVIITKPGLLYPVVRTVFPHYYPRSSFLLLPHIELFLTLSPTHGPQMTVLQRM